MKKNLPILVLSAFLLVGCAGNKPAPSSNNDSKSQETSTSNHASTSESSNSQKESSVSSASITPTFSVIFNDENGVQLANITYELGAIPSYSYNKPDTQEWDYTFKGWSLTKGGSVLSSLPAVTADATYFAIVEAKKQKYTLTFESNGGSSISPITVEYNSEIKKPNDPKMDGYNFVSWCTDISLANAVSWPIKLTENKTIYAKWNEKVDIKGYLQALVGTFEQDPYSYIPDKMEPRNSANHVNASDVNYNFANFVNVNSIKYGGFGEQWQMVIDNIDQSEMFYAVLDLADTIISASVTAFNNWFDNNPNDTNKEITETGYYAKVNFSNGILSYTIQLKTGLSVPLFGEILPQIDMTYDIKNNEKAVRINLSDSNAMRYVITDNQYVFGLKYGLENISRSSYLQLNKTENNGVQGHIYEYITLKDKDAVKSCADFYIDDTYTTVVGNKASGIVGMDGYINELYKTEEGKLLGYKVQETKTIVGISGTYHTLWFNLNNITGINSVKAIPNGNVDVAAKNTHDIYINGRSSIFEPTYNYLIVKTSRKYDIEMRTQYRYGYVGGELTNYKLEIPMMFIQDDHDGYTNYSEFEEDVASNSKVDAFVNLSETYLTKIRNDYDFYIPIFKENKDLVNSDTIENWIGSAVRA